MSKDELSVRVYSLNFHLQFWSEPEIKISSDLMDSYFYLLCYHL